MAVVGVAQEMPEHRRSSLLQNNRRQYFRRYLVQTDSKYDGPWLVSTAPLLPIPYAQYETDTEIDPSARVVRREPTQHPKNWMLWYVDVEYDTEYERKDGNPFQEPPKVEYDFEPYKEPLPGKPVQTVTSYSNNDQTVVTAWGGGITNSAGEPFNPPPERDASRLVVTYTRNEPSFSTAFALMFIDSVNRDAWNNLEPRQAFLRGIKAHLEYRKSTTFGQMDIPYFPVTYTFVMKRETWDLQILNIGSYYLAQAAVFDADGNVTNAPAKLTDTDDSGAKKQVLLKADGTKVTDGVPTFRRFRVCKETSFAALNININFTGV